MITHIVLVKFTPSSTPAERKVWRDEISALKSKLPQIKDQRVGKKVYVSEAAKQADGGWDDGVVMSFDNMEDLRAYAVSDAHTEYLKATASVTASKLIYDIES